jgi:nucleoside-diphosphate-sugar epimerase
MLVILGAGYAGRFLYARAIASGVPTLVTSRAPDSRLAFAPRAHRLAFDLERQTTWRNLPAGADLVWCFPAAPLDAVTAFAHVALPEARHVVILGSTSAYETSQLSAEKVFDESAPVDHTRPRVQGEEYLRSHFGAIILRVAGIYGPGRNVLDWIRRGKVGSAPRWVNLIHVDDLAAICLVALEKGQHGEVYNVSDGQPRRWSQICDTAQVRWGVVPTRTDIDASPGKQISNAKLTRDLQYRFEHSDLYSALDEIEAATSTQATDAPTPKSTDE